MKVLFIVRYYDIFIIIEQRLLVPVCIFMYDILNLGCIVHVAFYH